MINKRKSKAEGESRREHHLELQLQLSQRSNDLCCVTRNQSEWQEGHSGVRNKANNTWPSASHNNSALADQQL